MMWVLSQTTTYENGRTDTAYFLRKGLFGMQEYGRKADAMKFNTKREATLYAKALAGKHTAVKEEQ